MKTELPPILEAKLADFRQRVWTVKLIEGLLAAGFGLALSYLLVFALDRVMETPVWLRGFVADCRGGAWTRVAAEMASLGVAAAAAGGCGAVVEAHVSAAWRSIARHRGAVAA
jgi:proline dehydrogenase